MNLRNIAFGVLAAVQLSATFCLPACGESKVREAPTSYVINGYEDYYDLAWTSIHGELFGEISVSDDANYITQGEHSAKFALDNDSDFGSPEQLGNTLNIGSFKYQLVNYDEKFRWLDKIDRICIDIYNASDHELDIYFSAVAAGNNNLFTDGAVLAANSWNYLVFEIKPYLLEKDTAVQDYVFYLKGLENIPDRKATLYVDNFRADIYASSIAAPDVAQAPELNFGGIEILNFDGADDLSFIMTRNNAASEEMLPLFYARYDKTIKTFGESGALKINLEQSHKADDIWAEGQGYDIVVGLPVLKGISKPRLVGVDCANPSTVSHYVSLIVSSGKRTATVKKYVPARKTVHIEVDGLELDTVDALIIRIDSWKLTGKSQLYFSGLQYTV